MKNTTEELSPKNMSIEELTIKFQPIVKRVAIRHLNKYNNIIDLDDLISVGNIGLLDAIAKYNPSKDNLFKTYAEYRIKGAILDELRKLDCVSKHYRDEIKTMEKVIKKIKSETDRPISNLELCNHMNITSDKLAKIMLAKSTKVENHDTPQLETNYHSVINPEQKLNVLELIDRVDQEIQELTNKEQSILFLKYHKDLSFHEIGEMLKLSHSRISQIHTDIVKTLEISLGHVEHMLMAA